MKKIFSTVILLLFFSFKSFAAPDGRGQIQLSEDVVKSFIDYIVGDTGTQKSLFNKPGTFWITIDGSRSYSWYNPHGEGINTIKLLDETKKFWKKNKITGNVISNPFNI